MVTSRSAAPYLAPFWRSMQKREQASFDDEASRTRMQSVERRLQSGRGEGQAASARADQPIPSADQPLSFADQTSTFAKRRSIVAGVIYAPLELSKMEIDVTSYRIVERNGERDVLGEGLMWSVREGTLYWTDILKPALYRLHLATGETRSWAMPDMIGWVVERRDHPGLIAGFRSGFAELTLDPVAITPIEDPEPHLPNNRLNDAKADRWGRIWAGSMPIAIDRPSGALYRLDPDRTITQVDHGYTVANGPAISPDHCWLYHADTMLGRIYRFRLSEEKGIVDRELFVQFDDDWGLPDGMTTDAEGGLWVAHWGGSRVSRFTSTGTLDRVIDLPVSQVTNVCFAGDQLDRMFVTSAALEKEAERFAGALFEVDPGGVCGLPGGQFGG